MLAPFPYKVTGVSAGFASGRNIVCGGAKMTYTDCRLDQREGGQLCDRNLDCVTTLGGSRWCSGPKTGKCYSYSQLTQVTKQTNLFEH